MKLKTVLSLFTFLALGSASIFQGCKDKTDDEPILPLKGVQLATHTTLGNILTDSVGKSLYIFSSDVTGVSACSGNCATTWPAYYTANATTATGLTSTDFATITRTDGSKQTTFKGWPLYYYKNDTKAGDVLGDKVGNAWYVAKPDYSIMFGKVQLVGNDTKQYIYSNNLLVEGQGITEYLTDGMGRTLYTFGTDKANKNTFTKADLTNNTVWPVYETEVKKVPSTLDITLFGTIDVFGKKQLTYMGWPLYHFGSDAQVRGITKGVSVKAWPIARMGLSAAPAQ